MPISDNINIPMLIFGIIGGCLLLGVFLGGAAYSCTGELNKVLKCVDPIPTPALVIDGQMYLTNNETLRLLADKTNNLFGKLN